MGQPSRRETAELMHDLRAPLTLFRGYLQLLERTVLNEEQREYVEILDSKSESLRVLIESIDVLVGNVPKNLLRRVDVCEVLSANFFGLEREFSARGIELIADFPAAEVYAFADEKLLARAFQNLTVNALKHGSGYLKANVARRGDGYISIVFENGVAECDSWGEGALAQASNGQGLGLSIVQKFVEKMAGSFFANKTESCFIAEIRLRQGF